MGAANPADIFIPILSATYVSTLAGLIAVAVYQRLNLFNRVVMAYLIGGTLAVGGFNLVFFRVGQGNDYNDFHGS